MHDFHDRTAVVTGAASGIGRGIARALSSAGARVVVADIDLDAVEIVAAELRGRGAEAHAVAVDVSSERSVVALADVAYERLGSVDVLCNNAGVSLKPFRAIWDTSLDDWRFMIDVNLWGVIHGMHTFIPRMREQPGRKHIVNTASEAPLMAMTGHSAYAAAKAAVITLSEVAAKELASEGFGLTILAPGAVATAISTTERLRPPEHRSDLRAVPAYDSPDVAHYLADRSLYLDPDDVGALVRDAILANQLFLLTHPAPPDVASRTRDLLAGPGVVASES